MFKIEVNVNGQTFGHYWMNKHEDDFLKFLPDHFTKEYATIIESSDLTVYKVGEENFNLFEGKLNQHPNNTLDCDDGGAGVMRVCRVDAARLEAGFIPLAFFNDQKEKREEIFVDAVTPQTVTSLTTVQHDFGNGAEDAVEVPVDHELTLEHCSIELSLTGVALSQWPYDSNGKFLGNN